MTLIEELRSPMPRRTREFLTIGATAAAARSKCLRAIARYARTHAPKYVKYLHAPETVLYDGRSRKLRNKWRCYARVEVNG